MRRAFFLIQGAKLLGHDWLNFRMFLCSFHDRYADVSCVFDYQSQLIFLSVLCLNTLPGIRPTGHSWEGYFMRISFHKECLTLFRGGENKKIREKYKNLANFVFFLFSWNLGKLINEQFNTILPSV